MELMMRNFVLNKAKSGKYYIHLSNTISAQYAGNIRTCVICNLSNEAKKELEKDKKCEKFFINEAIGFMSVTLHNAIPVPTLCFTSIKVGIYEQR